MKTQEEQRKKRITEWTWRMEGWRHWWTIAQWCQSAPDHLRLCWINADIPVIVDLIIEIILQYQNEKESDVIMDQTTFIFVLVFDWSRNTKRGKSFTVLFGDTTPAVSGIEHVTFGRSNHSALLAVSLPTYHSTSFDSRLHNSSTATPGSCSTKVRFMPGLFLFLSFSDQTSIFLCEISTFPAFSSSVLWS